ncbi:Ribosomal protein S6 kinase alpha-5, partial [Pseudolycoriella hygida]
NKFFFAVDFNQSDRSETSCPDQRIRHVFRISYFSDNNDNKMERRTNVLNFSKKIDVLRNREAEGYVDHGAVSISHFDLIKLLGKGTYGKVFLGRKNRGIDKNVPYAVKVVRKKDIFDDSGRKTNQAINERQILELLRSCPYTSSMCYAFQTTENLFLVMEYVPGGDIFTNLDYGVLSEDVAIFYIAELIVALERMHEQNIVHRDIKVENVMIDKDGHIQLVDFGLSTKLRPRQRTNSHCGSDLYMSPEISSHSEHDTATDMWSLGILAYHVLTLEFPFGENEKRAPERIINDDPIIEGLSLEMTDFILTLLVKDPAKRPSAKEVKKHQVFKGIDWEKLEKKELEPPNGPPFLEDSFDTVNFDKDFTQEKPICESSAVPTKQFLAFKGYYYIAPELSENNNNECGASSSRNALRNIETNTPHKFVTPETLNSAISSACKKWIRSSDNIGITAELPLYIEHVLCIPNNRKFISKYLPGGDIFTYLDYGVLSEDVAIFYFAELIVALERMHEQNIVHRDIKTENVMIDKDGHIQLVDFGLSIKLRPRQRTNTYGGSVLYMSPEILSHSEHDTATDMWSLGVLAYHVLTLEFPFGENEKRAPERIINDDPIIEGLSLEMTDFILTLLVKDPAKRPSAKEVKKHPVFKGIDWEKLEKKELESANDPPFMEDPFDTGNFDKEFTQEKPICESSAVPTKQFLAFKGYYYIAPELSENNNNECGASSSRNALRNIETNTPHKFVTPETLNSGISSACKKWIRSSDSDCSNTNQLAKRFKP